MWDDADDDLVDLVAIFIKYLLIQQRLPQFNYMPTNEQCDSKNNEWINLNNSMKFVYNEFTTTEEKNRFELGKISQYFNYKKKKQNR